MTTDEILLKTIELHIENTRIEKIRANMPAKRTVRALTVIDVFNAVSAYYMIPIETIFNGSRKYGVVEPRHMAWRIVKDKKIAVSLKDIGAISGRYSGIPYNHTTVIHGQNVTQRKIDTDPQIKEKYDSIIGLLNQ